MTNEEFLFWLWGPYELNENTGDFVLDAKQLDVIEKHVQLVKSENLYTSGFVSWLEGVLDITQLIDPIDEVEAFEAMTNLIYDRLKKEFIRKAETIAALADRPALTFPDHPIIPRWIDPKKVCSRVESGPFGVSIVPLNQELASNLSQEERMAEVARRTVGSC